MQLAVTHIHADHLRRAVLQQAVGEPARALPHVEAAQPRHRQAGGPQRPFELEPPARDVFGPGIVEQPHLGHGRYVVTILGNLLPRGQRRQAPLHARGNQPLRLRARGRMAKIHQKYICTHAPILFESKEPLAPVYKAQIAIISEQINRSCIAHETAMPQKPAPPRSRFCRAAVAPPPGLRPEAAGLPAQTWSKPKRPRPWRQLLRGAQHLRENQYR